MYNANINNTKKKSKSENLMKMSVISDGTAPFHQNATQNSLQNICHQYQKKKILKK